MRPNQDQRQSSSRRGEVDAWVLTARLSPRPLVRAAAVDAEGQAVNSYPLVHPTAGRRPQTPWAVHLADADGNFHLLCADLDANTSPQDAAEDAARLSGLLNEAGVPHVVCASGPTGGRHVWLGLCEPVDAVLVSALAHLLKAWLPTLDLSPLLNPVAGCVRPPGAPHRLGGASRVTTGAVSVLTHPTVTADQVRALVARLAERLQPPTPTRPAGRRPVAMADGMPFLPGPKRRLSASCRAALETVPTGDLSSVLWRVLCGAAAARWRFADLAAIANAPGLEHARTHRTGATRTMRPAAGAASPAAVLRRQWTRAVRTVAELDADPHQHGDDPSFDGRAELVAELVRAVQGRADAAAGRWGGSRAGLGQRRILDALCLYHLQAVRVCEVEADIRRLALTCGLDRETARRALLALAGDGWIARTRQAVGCHGALWTIDPGGAVHTRISGTLSQAVPRPAGTGAALRFALNSGLSHRLATSAHDAFAPRGGLGIEAGSTYGRLSEATGPLAAARLIGWTMAKTTRILERLASHGLLTAEGEGWKLSDEKQLNRLAVEFGTAGRHQQRAVRYATERASWEWWQAELVWMRAPRPTRLLACRRAGLRLSQGGHRWPAHPRRSTGRADFAAARHALELAHALAVDRGSPSSRGMPRATHPARERPHRDLAVHSVERGQRLPASTYGEHTIPRNRITPSRTRPGPAGLGAASSTDQDVSTIPRASVSVEGTLSYFW